MAFLFEHVMGQDLAGQQSVPMLYAPLNASAVTDPDQPGILQMFRGDFPDGNLLVALAGASGSVLLPDDVDAVPEVSTNDRVPTVARNYVYDPFFEVFNRWRGDSDDVEAIAPDATDNAGVVQTRPYLYNESGDLWRRARTNDNLVILASAARVATTNSATFINNNWRGGQFIIDVTAITATPSVVFSIEGLDVITGTFFSLLDSVAIVAVGTTILRVYPGLTAVANLVASDLLPFQYRVTGTHADADSITYSVSFNSML